MKKSTPTRGRPRSEASSEAILLAAFALLQERGYAGMTFDAVAAQAGVGKTTIYRWWPTRPTLAVEAFFAGTQAELAFPDTGSAREDFRLQILQLAKLLRGPAGAAMAAMIAGARTDPELGHAIAQRWVAPRARWGRERLVRACAAGECAPDLDIAAALDVLYSPLYARLLMGLEALTPTQVEKYLRIVFSGIFV
jgi:AcrR family transcriptional regulator